MYFTLSLNYLHYHHYLHYLDMFWADTRIKAVIRIRQSSRAGQPNAAGFNQGR